MRDSKPLGSMQPVGGGDPIPLRKKELVVGRRPSCDIRLDFENISGRHCMLTFANGTWNVRDLGSTNGTKINNQKLQREQAILPDDELAIATHLFRIDYEPTGQLVDSQQMLEEEEAIRAAEAHRPTSLMELAGFTDDAQPRRPRPPEPRPDPSPAHARSLTPSPEPVPGPSTASPGDDLDAAPAPRPIADDDFFKLIEDEVRPERR